MTAISYHDTVKDVQDPDCWGEGPFARREWFALLEEAGRKPLVAVGRVSDAVACLPFENTARGLETLSNWYAFTWAPVCDEAALSAVAHDLRSKAHRIDCAKVPDENGYATRLEQAFDHAGWHVQRFATDTNHILHLNGRDYAAYLADRPGPLRTTLKRKAQKVDVRISQVFSADDWQSYETIYAESWKPEEGDPALLRAFAENESAAGRYRFGVASLDGEAVAAQFWTVDGGTAYIHKLAHRESAKAVSPGTTLTAALFEHVIDADGVQTVDFGTGDDPYKRDWMEEQRPRYQLTFLRRSDPRNWPAIAKHALRKLVRRDAAG